MGEKVETEWEEGDNICMQEMLSNISQHMDALAAKETSPWYRMKCKLSRTIAEKIEVLEGRAF